VASPFLVDATWFTANCVLAGFESLTDLRGSEVKIVNIIILCIKTCGQLYDNLYTGEPCLCLGIMHAVNPLITPSQNSSIAFPN